jgi:hypothetical protein
MNHQHRWREQGSAGQDPSPVRRVECETCGELGVLPPEGWRVATGEERERFLRIAYGTSAGGKP